MVAVQRQAAEEMFVEYWAPAATIGSVVIRSKIPGKNHEKKSWTPTPEHCN